jgi:methylmalonyl-CoA/ethylmalonyl-CoA epimerase
LVREYESMASKVDHLGVVVRDLGAAIPQWEILLGVAVAHREQVTDQGVEVASLPVGETEIELICPIQEGTGIARYLEKRGEGLHHVCFLVENLEEELRRLAEAGVRLIDQKPRVGAGGHAVAFLHPSATGGVLTELKERR